MVYYQEAVEKSEADVEKQRDYLNQSAVMQLDASRLQTGTLSFYLNIQDGDTAEQEALVAAYRAYAEDGRLAGRLSAEDQDILEADLQKLIVFSNGQLEYSTEEGELFNLSEKNVFQIQLTAPNKELCGRWLDTAEAAVAEYSRELQDTIAGHELRLLASALTERIDSEIQAYQTSVLTNYTAAVKTLQALRKDLEAVQSEEGETIVLEEETEEKSPAALAVKSAVTGVTLSALLVMFILSLSYIMGGKVHNLDTFEEDYGIKLLGCIAEPASRKGAFGFVDRFIRQMEEGAYAKLSVSEQIKLATANLRTELSKNENLRKVMLAGTIPEKETRNICKQLKNGIEGVTFSSYQRLVFSSDAVDKLANYDAVVFLEKEGSSQSKFVEKEKKIAEGRGKKVLGVIML